MAAGPLAIHEIGRYDSTRRVPAIMYGFNGTGRVPTTIKEKKMAKITMFKGYQGEPPIPKPAHQVQANVVTVQDGVPVKYSGCDGIGVRVVHPANPNAPAQNLGLVIFFVPPHVVLEPGSHHTEECYVILKGKGVMTLAGEKVPVEAGTFIHLPPWCEHGIENTGDESMEVLICTSPPNP